MTQPGLEHDPEEGIPQTVPTPTEPAEESMPGLEDLEVDLDDDEVPTEDEDSEAVESGMDDPDVA